MSTAEAPSPSPRRRLPGRRRAAGGRKPSCQGADAKLIALTPSDNLSLTTAQQPTLLLYVSGFGRNRRAEFVLRDSQDSEVYSGEAEISDQSHWMMVEFAQLDPPVALTTNEDYQWYFSVVCPEDRSADAGVDGWIRVVDPQASWQNPPLENRILQASEQSSPIQLAQTLLQLNLWHDAVITLAQAQLDSLGVVPTDHQVRHDWQQLLSDDPIFNQLVATPLERVMPF